jgi:hypothetical protein
MKRFGFGKVKGGYQSFKIALFLLKVSLNLKVNAPRKQQAQHPGTSIQEQNAQE